MLALLSRAESGGGNAPVGVGACEGVPLSGPSCCCSPLSAMLGSARVNRQNGEGEESTHTHPAHAAPTEHAVLIAHSAASSRALDGAATANLDALDPAVKAADDVARVRSLLQISAFQLIDIVLDDGQLLVQLALLLEGLAEGGSQ